MKKLVPPQHVPMLQFQDIFVSRFVADAKKIIELVVEKLLCKRCVGSDITTTKLKVES
jgi:hypothetical protein